MFKVGDTVEDDARSTIEKQKLKTLLFLSEPQIIREICKEDFI